MTRTLPLLALLLASGCTMAPDYERPEAPIPQAFPQGEAYPQLAPGPDETPPPALERDAIFTDERLQALMDQALENNRDLRVAAANIVRGRSQFRAQRAALLPQVDVGGGIQAVDNANGSTTSVTASASVSAFELDLFGRIQSLSNAAQERYFATEAAARATRLALLGDIANAWLAYAADRSLLDIALSTAETARKTSSLVEARLRNGVANRADYAQAQTILATAESDLARQKTFIAQDLNYLTLLVGAPVDPALLPQGIETAGPTIADPPLATDSDVLLSRPDVLAAEYTLRAANADIGAARAALFPRISLSGLAGLASGSLESLFGDGGRSVLQGGGVVSYPIFRAGAGKANLRASKAQRDAALASYEKSIQVAFREVADALARRGTIEDQLDADGRRADAAGEALRLSDSRYRGGVDSFLVNLDSQRSYYTAQRVLVTTRLEAARNRVALYRTLGGDALTPEPDEPGGSPSDAETGAP